MSFSLPSFRKGFYPVLLLVLLTGSGVRAQRVKTKPTTPDNTAALEVGISARAGTGVYYGLLISCMNCVRRQAIINPEKHSLLFPAQDHKSVFGYNASVRKGAPGVKSHSCGSLAARPDEATWLFTAIAA